MYVEDNTNNKIQFLFTLDALFEKISAHSIYSAKNIRSQDGASLLDQYAITEDEKEFIIPYLYDATHDLYAIFSKMSVGIDSALYFDKLLDVPGQPTGTKKQMLGWDVIQYLKPDGKRAYNANRLPLIDQNCTDYLVNYVLAKWAEVNKQADELSLTTKSLMDAERKLVNNLFEIQKPAITKSYTIR